MTGFLEALSWLALLLDSACVLVVFFLVFGGAKWVDGDDV